MTFEHKIFFFVACVLCFLALVGCNAVVGVTETPVVVNEVTAVASLTPLVSSTPSVVQTPLSATPFITSVATFLPNTATAVATTVVAPTAIPSTPTMTSTPEHVWPTPDTSLPTPATAIPTPVPALPSSPDVVNIALLGNDGDWSDNGRTDSIIIVSINTSTKTATMLSLPRDLYVYIPGWTMNRLNLAFPHGNANNYLDQGGGKLLADTILYNFGIPVDHYVRIGFNGFKDIVDSVGGIEVVVNCYLTDWRLKTPDLDPQVEENWEQFTLAPGIYEMDGDLALWYARSRHTTNDFERGRRQQQILRALLDKGIDLNLIANAPQLWATFQDSIETDMSFTEILSLASIASDVRANGVQHLYMAGDAVKAWTVTTTGEAVQLLQWEYAAPIAQHIMQPPLLNRATHPPITVEVITNDTVYYRQTAENLAWVGFVPVHSTRTAPVPDVTKMTYFAPNFKGSYNWLLAWVFKQDAFNIELNRDPDASAYNYRVELGYDYNACLPQLEAPYSEPLPATPTLTPTP